MIDSKVFSFSSFFSVFSFLSFFFKLFSILSQSTKNFRYHIHLPILICPPTTVHFYFVSFFCLHGLGLMFHDFLYSLSTFHLNGSLQPSFKFQYRNCRTQLWEQECLPYLVKWMAFLCTLVPCPVSNLVFQSCLTFRSGRQGSPLGYIIFFIQYFKGLFQTHVSMLHIWLLFTPQCDYGSSFPLVPWVSSCSPPYL